MVIPPGSGEIKSVTNNYLKLGFCDQIKEISVNQRLAVYLLSYCLIKI